MNYTTEKEIRSYLESYKELDNYIDELIREKEEWYSKALSIKGGHDTGIKVQTNRKNTAVCSAIEKVESLENQITEKIDILCDLRKSLNNKIKLLNDITLEKIIYLKYIKGISFCDIADEMGYCERQISRLHKRAIEIMFGKK